LRGNGGGSLYDVIQMAGLFISTGPICQVKGKYDKPTILPDKDSKIQYDGPLIVMVDGTSASASEIFSAAIQDYKRGVIIGASSTYGKGTVQKNIPLGQGLNIFSNDDPEMGVVKLTLQKFYRINGGATQLRGVTPDIVLPDRFDYLKFREKDNPAALQWDEIPRATYEPVRTDNYFDKVIANTNSEVKESAIFSSIKSSVNWLDQYNDREYSLNINKYKSEQKQLKETFNLLDSLVKLKAPLTLMNLNADTAKVNSTEDKREKNKQWLKARSNDVYIDESIKVMDRLILQNNTSSAKAKL
jgi:carboxyl-terminal processing protease